MANGLLCSETLVATPKYRHDSNGENTPPQYNTDIKSYDLFCTEVLTDQPLAKPVLTEHKQLYENFNHPPVKADCDSIILKDDRVLQNLLRNQDRYSWPGSDYFLSVQVEVKEHMRKIVADWMLEVCQELYCQPEVFCFAVNIMDRFLSIQRISKTQLQLLGAACLFLSSKFKALDHISSEKLVFYTDYSITIQELKDWELLVLHKLSWELSSTIPLDFLDHILPRLSLPPTIATARLRLKTETIIALSATSSRFTHYNPSLLAAASILTALVSANQETKDRTLESILRVSSLEKESSAPAVTDKQMRDIRLTLQILTHSGADSLDACCRDLNECIPGYLTGHTVPAPNSPDTTLNPSQPSFYPSEVPEVRHPSPSPSPAPSSLSPAPSSLDIFSDLSDLQSVLHPTSADTSVNSSFSSILVT